MEAQNAIGQPTKASKATLLALTGVGDGTATDDQRQMLLGIMRDAEAKEIEFRRVALTARSLVEEIDVARGLNVREKTGDLEDRFASDQHDDNHARNGGEDILETMRFFASDYPNLQWPTATEHEVLDEHECRPGPPLLADDDVNMYDYVPSRDTTPQRVSESSLMDEAAVTAPENDDDDDMEELAASTPTATQKDGRRFSPIQLRSMAYSFVIWKNWEKEAAEVLRENSHWRHNESNTFTWHLMQISFGYNYTEAMEKINSSADPNSQGYIIDTKLLKDIAGEVLVDAALRKPQICADDFASTLWSLDVLSRRKWLKDEPSKVFRAECRKHLEAKWKDADFDVAPLSRLGSMSGAELWLLCNLAMSIDTFEAARELLQNRADDALEPDIGIHHIYRVLVNTSSTAAEEALLRSASSASDPMGQENLGLQDDSSSEEEDVQSQRPRRSGHLEADAESNFESPMSPIRRQSKNGTKKTKKTGASSQAQKLSQKELTRLANLGHPKGYQGYDLIEGPKAVWFHVISKNWKMSTSKIFTSHEMWPFYVPGDLLLSLMRVSSQTDYKTALQKLEVLWMDPIRMSSCRWDYATNRPDDVPAKRRIIKSQAMVKIERELYKHMDKKPMRCSLEDRLWDTFSLTEHDLLTATPSEGLRKSYLNILHLRWGRPISDIFSDAVWPPVKTMSGSFLWLLCELAKKTEFDVALIKMREIVKAEKEDYIAWVTIYDLLMDNDAPPLHECRPKKYRGPHHWEIHRRLGELSDRGRRTDQKMIPTAPIVPIWPQTISAKDLCQNLYRTWGRWGPPRVEDYAHAAASESEPSGDDDDNESQEVDAEFAHLNDDVKYHGKAEDTEAVDTTLYDAKPAPPNRSDMTTEKSPLTSNDDKEQTPEVTKERNTVRAFPKRTRFTVPKPEPDLSQAGNHGESADEGDQNVKMEESVDLSTVPIKQEEPVSTFSISKVDDIRKALDDVEEEIHVLKNARLTKVDPISRADFKYHDTNTKELEFMSNICSGPTGRERKYIVQRICNNWSLPADEVFSTDHAMWPDAPPMPFLLRLLVLSHVTKHRTAVAGLKKVLEQEKRAAGDILERRCLNETTVDRVIDSVCPGAKDVLKGLKAKRLTEGERMKRESTLERLHESEQRPAFEPAPEETSMPPPPRPRPKRASTSVAIDYCTHEKCAMVPSNDFWEANQVIGSDGMAQLMVGPTEADLVPECQINPQLPRTKRRRRRSSSIKLEGKENVSRQDKGGCASARDY